jgi:U3 small nucleolar RNA-associated protein 12
MWHETGHRAEVTYILKSPRKNSFAVGYADGSIRIWDAANGTVITTFNGHKNSVTALAFDEQGTRLASGSQDTDLIVWDLVAEAGLYRYVNGL